MSVTPAVPETVTVEPFKLIARSLVAVALSKDTHVILKLLAVVSNVPANTCIAPELVKLLPRLNVPPIPLIIIGGIVLPLVVIMFVPEVAPNVIILEDATTVIPADNV